MASFNRGISTWRSLGAITLAFFAGSIALSTLPTPETSFTSLADLVDTSSKDVDGGTRFLTKPVALFANMAKATGDWPMWGGTPSRNNVPEAANIPADWEIGEFDDDDQWVPGSGTNIKWVAPLGSQTYGNPVVAGGRVYVGTNNGSGHIKRYPAEEWDLGCLICFDEEDGSFLWQHSSEKLSTGRVHDWPLQGICCAPCVQGDRLWFVTSRGEVRCLDTEGFHDGQDDGPVQGEKGRLFDIANPSQDAYDEAVKELESDSISDSARQRFARVVASKEVYDAAIKTLESGRISDAIRDEFATLDMTVDGDVDVSQVTPGRAWMVKGKLGGVERGIDFKVIGPRLSAFMTIGVHDKREADTVWVLDMMKTLGVSQHNMCSCSVTAVGGILFVNTSNGLDESHINLPRPDAPSFIAVDQETGDVLWSDKSPGKNILHGQWSSPAVGILGGVPQAVFTGGDGWVYSFKAAPGKDGEPELLWKFDANPKNSKWILGGRGTRNNIIATPVLYEGLVYVAVGQDPEHGEGEGHLWCIDPTKRGDVSPQLAMKVEGGERIPIEHRRLQAVIEEEGEVAVDNDNSAVVWHYSKFDQDGNGEFDFEEEMHRSCGTVAIKDDVLYISDFSGLFHCLDAKTGKVHWTYDMFAAAWGSPLIVDDKVYIGDEDGEVSIFKFGDTENNEPIAVMDMGNSVYSTPIVANGILYIANKTHLFAIAANETE